MITQTDVRQKIYNGFIRFAHQLEPDLSAAFRQRLRPDLVRFVDRFDPPHDAAAGLCTEGGQVVFAVDVCAQLPDAHLQTAVAHEAQHLLLLVSGSADWRNEKLTDHLVAGMGHGMKSLRDFLGKIQSERNHQ